MATVQVTREGTVVIFGLPVEGGSKRLVASLMRGKIAGQALLALRSLEVPLLRTQVSKEITFDVPKFYRDGELALPNTKEQRRYLRMQVPGRQPLWFRFVHTIDPDLVALLDTISAKPVNPSGNPQGAARRFKYGQSTIPIKRRKKRRKAAGAAKEAKA